MPTREHLHNRDSHSTSLKPTKLLTKPSPTTKLKPPRFRTQGGGSAISSARLFATPPALGYASTSLGDNPVGLKVDGANVCRGNSAAGSKSGIAVDTGTSKTSNSVDGSASGLITTPASVVNISVPGAATGSASSAAGPLSSEEFGELLLAIRNHASPPSETMEPFFHASTASLVRGTSSDEHILPSAHRTARLMSSQVLLPSSEAFLATPVCGCASGSTAALVSGTEIFPGTRAVATDAVLVSSEQFEDLLLRIGSIPRTPRGRQSSASDVHILPPVHSEGHSRPQFSLDCPVLSYMDPPVPLPPREAMQAPHSPEWYDDGFPIPLTAPPFSEVPDLYYMPVRNLTRPRK